MSWPVPPFLSADAPIEAAGEDRLDRSRLAGQLGRRLLGYHGDRALAVGVCGDWGSGKTSFINLVAESIKADAGLREGKAFPVVRFTPWALGTRDDIAADLLREIGGLLRSSVGQRRFMELQANR